MRKLYIIGLIGLVGIVASVAFAEQITLTTYYPAPFGVYKQMRTTESLLLQAEPTNSDGPQIEWRTSDIGVERHWNIDQYQDAISTRLRFFTEDNSDDTNPAERVTILENGNVGIGTTGPAAILDVSSTTSGFVPPRMTTAQRNAISAPPAGSMLYNTDDEELNYYDGSAWQTQGGGGGCYVSYSGGCLAGLTNMGSAGWWGFCRCSGCTGGYYGRSHFRPPGGGCAGGWPSANIGQAYVCCQ